MPQRDLDKEKKWRRLLRRWRQSGLSGRDFCAAERVSEPSFYFWRREIARRDQHKGAQRKRPSGRIGTWPRQRQSAGAKSPAFLELAIAAGGAASPAIEVVVGERVLRVRPGVDVELLRQLLRLLEEPSC